MGFFTPKHTLFRLKQRTEDTSARATMFVVVTGAHKVDIRGEGIILKRTHPARTKTTHVERRGEFYRFSAI